MGTCGGAPGDKFDKKVGFIIRGARLDTSLKLTKKTFSLKAPLGTLPLGTAGGMGLTLLLRKVEMSQ